jgi:translation initiation factor IF-1
LAKEELLEVDGSVTELLPNAMFRIRLDNEHEVLATTSGRMRRGRIRVAAGDRVTIEMTPYDLSKGRIIYRHKDEKAQFSAAPRARPPAARRR